MQFILSLVESSCSVGHFPRVGVITGRKNIKIILCISQVINILFNKWMGSFYIELKLNQLLILEDR